MKDVILLKTVDGIILIDDSSYKTLGIVYSISTQRVSVVVDRKLDLNRYPWDHRMPNFGRF